MEGTASYPPVGYMPIPADWKHADIVRKGRPCSLRVHMPNSRRAKIFAPFDALAGFDDAVASKEVLYEEKRRMSSQDLEAFNQTLARLKALTINGRVARENKVLVEAEYYVPCDDENSFSYRIQGQYKKITGICWKVDDVFGTIKVDDKIINLDDVYKLNVMKNEV